MKRSPLNSLSILLLLTLGACKTPEKQNTEQLPYYNSADFTPHWFDAPEELPADFHQIPAFNLLNQNGDTITESNFDEHIYIADFFFTSCPGICPKMTGNMKLLQNKYLNDDAILLLSHSVTPEKDSVPILADYAQENGVITSKWHLLTGDRKQIYDLGRKAYFAEEDLGVNKTEEDFLHTENFLLIDKNKHIRGIYNGLNKGSIQQLISDIELLKKQK